MCKTAGWLAVKKSFFLTPMTLTREEMVDALVNEAERSH